MYKLVPVVKLKHFPTDSIRLINLLCRPVNGALFFSPQNVKNYFSNYKIFPTKTILNGQNYCILETQNYKLSYCLGTFFQKKNRVQPLASNLMGWMAGFSALSHWKCIEIKAVSSLPLSCWINQLAWGILCAVLAPWPFHFKTFVYVPPSAWSIAAYLSIVMSHDSRIKSYLLLMSSISNKDTCASPLPKYHLPCGN